MIAAAERILAAGALGVVSGLFGGLFGIGGGVLAIPPLGLAHGLHPQMAQGTVLVMGVPHLPLRWQWTALVGLAGGIVSGLFGVGGAFIVPPALTAFFGLRQIEAQGLGLALVSPVTLVALVTYARAGEVDWGLGIPLAVGGIAAIPAGVAAAYRLPERRLRLAFCGLLF